VTVIHAHAILNADDILDLDAPELALLGALEHVLRAACAAIEAANPELLRAERSELHLEREALPRLWSAEDIRAHAHTLADAIARYRHALCLANADDRPGFPF
jgi:hypothetical protein